MQHQEFEPPEALRDIIRCFWYNVKVSGEEQTAFEVMPDGYAEIIFHFREACSISENGKLQLMPSPFMMGLLNQPVVFYTKNRLEIIGVRCYPWTVFDLLGIQAGNDAMRTFEHPIARLQPELNKFILEGRVKDALARIEAYFLDARAHIATDSMLFKAGLAMTKTRGRIGVSDVAEAAHTTIRTLERRFKQSSGFTVKDVSGLMRFEQVRNELWNHPESGLSALAQTFGYADQSHLSREFKRYSGTTPAAFARKAKQTGSMRSADFVVFVQA